MKNLTYNFMKNLTYNFSKFKKANYLLYTYNVHTPRLELSPEARGEGVEGGERRCVHAAHRGRHVG